MPNSRFRPGRSGPPKANPHRDWRTPGLVGSIRVLVLASPAVWRWAAVQIQLCFALRAAVRRREALNLAERCLVYNTWRGTPRLLGLRYRFQSVWVLDWFLFMRKICFCGTEGLAASSVASSSSNGSNSARVQIPSSCARCAAAETTG